MFGLGFTEIMIIMVIAILFLGPDKLPSAMIDVAKFFKQMKTTVGNVKDTLEQEINVSEIKEEALAYKKELLDAQAKLESVTDISKVTDSLSNLNEDILSTIDDDEPEKPKAKQNVEEKVTFEKKPKKEDKNV